MTSFDAGLTLADRMRTHATDKQHLYACLMRGMADDWDAGGPVRDICRGWEDSPRGAVVQLRLLAGVFRIVLTDRAPQLVAFYPCLGGTKPPADAWPLVRDVMAAHVQELQVALETAPQTNEVGRSTALLVGLFEAVRRSGLSRIRLLEPGASAGLNLLVDEFRFVNDGWAFGPVGSPLVLANGVVGDVHPTPFEIIDRRGCDLAPVDASTAEGQLRLQSFVWPFQTSRHARLGAALAIAATHPVTIDEAAAGEWLEDQLRVPIDGDVLTVVWHSITRMYWPREETERVAAAITAARARTAVAHVAMEYPDVGGAQTAELTLALSPPVGSAADHLATVERQGGPVHLSPQWLGTVGDHGTPVTLEPPRQ